MTDHRQKLQDLLRDLFQFDCADLDFGIYRIMNHKRAEIERFIEKDLLDAVTGELEKGALAGQAQAKAELDDAEREVNENLGTDAISPDGELADEYAATPLGQRYLELREQAEAYRARPEQEATILNHLYEFFRRYYQDGDFISKRRYSTKRERYAIPYNGEEVHLHWANRDQYYVKTAEHFTDYTFKAPDGACGERSRTITVHFRLKAADTEQDNVKGEKRFFLPQADDLAWDEDSRTVTISFEYRPLTEQEKITHGATGQQDKIIAEALAAIPAKLTQNAEALAALSAEKRRNAQGEPVSYLEHHLRRYAARNTRDFFIHKDLRGFLDRELDFYLKNEVLNLDEVLAGRPAIASATAGDEARAEGLFQTARVIRGIAGHIITFLAQIEDFQKRLFEKKKFVVTTGYIIGLKSLRGILSDAKYRRYKRLLAERILADPGYRRDVEEVVKAALKRPGDNVYVSEVRFTQRGVAVRYAKRFTDEAEMREYVESSGRRHMETREELVRGARTTCYMVDYEAGTLPTRLPYDDFYLDTQYFSEDFVDGLLDDICASTQLDAFVDALILHADGWQALDLLSAKYAERVGCIYVDPPYNTGNDEFLYKDRYQHSCWLSMIKDRVASARHFLSQDGSFYASIDWNESHALKMLLDQVFGQEAFEREIIWNTGENISGFKSMAPNWIRQHDTIYFYSKDPENLRFRKLWRPIEDGRRPAWFDLQGADKNALHREGWPGGKVQAVGVEETRVKPLGDVWNDILSFQYSEPRVTESWFFDTQKVEALIRRIVQASTEPGDTVMDFFLGSGTTSAVAMKLGRKSIGVEIAEPFVYRALVRLKSTVIGETRTHLSREVEWPGGGTVKYQRLESYEDALNNISFDAQGGQAAMEFEDYLLRYMLDFETRDSETLLNVEKLESPFDYRLTIHTDGETRAQAVDLPETFNYLIGLHVKTRRVYHDDDRRYLVYRGSNERSEVAVIWRTTRGWTKEDFERDKEFVLKQKLTEGADEVYVNGDSLIPDAKSLDPVFKRRMLGDA